MEDVDVRGDGHHSSTWVLSKSGPYQNKSNGSAFCCGAPGSTGDVLVVIGKQRAGGVGVG